MRELPALGRVHKHCVIFAAMRFEVMYQFSPRGMNVSLNAVISRYFFFSHLKLSLNGNSYQLNQALYHTGAGG